MTMEANEEKLTRLLQITMSTRETHDRWFLIVSNIFFTFTSTFSNIVILTALSKESSLHPPSKILFRSLALTDLCVGLLAEPLFVISLFAIEYEGWNFLYSIMTFSYIASISLCSLSLFTLTAISMDRLLALLLGLRYRQVVTFKRVLMFVISFWTLNIGLATVAFWSFTFTSHYTFISNLFCLAVSTCCYIKIYQTLRHRQAQVQIHQRQSNREEPLNIARYRKTVSSALWVHLTLVVCYLPTGVVVASMSIMAEMTPSLWIALVFSAPLVYFNSTLNPILYCWKIRDVRRAARDIIRNISCSYT